VEGLAGVGAQYEEMKKATGSLIKQKNESKQLDTGMLDALNAQMKDIESKVKFMIDSKLSDLNEQVEEVKRVSAQLVFLSGGETSSKSALEEKH
jgi:Tfp pilus assembly protein PilO